MGGVMNVKPPESVLKKPCATWLTISDYDKFVALAKKNKVTLAAYLRAIITDTLADESK
jgi:hypothetical protein